jgi:hypothetical protein
MICGDCFVALLVAMTGNSHLEIYMLFVNWDFGFYKLIGDLTINSA